MNKATLSEEKKTKQLQDPEFNQAKSFVLMSTDKQENPFDCKEIIKGYDFNNPLDYSKLFESYKVMGFQASALGKSLDIINKMIKWRLSDDPIADDDNELDLKNRENVKCTIFLGYTSNMASCGMRETIRYLCEHKMIDAIVTTTGGIEEDFIKCLAPTYLGDFQLKGSELRDKGLNRIGNLLVPNDNYCLFEDWINPLLSNMLEIQKKEGKIWSPSEIIKFLGEKINHKESIYYWAAKNDIPVFCPALTDGSIGDMMFFHSYRNPGFICDIVSDVVKINKIALKAKKSGMIILGGGVIKHHICNANLMRNGADYAVYINTAQEFDGSDSGARPDEAVSWGKIRGNAESVKIHCDATIVFPIIVSETFVKNKEIASRAYK
jgi:deoxyhypusine synthase